MAPWCCYSTPVSPRDNYVLRTSQHNDTAACPAFPNINPNIACYHLLPVPASNGSPLLSIVQHWRYCWRPLTHLVFCQRRTSSAHSTVSSDPLLWLLSFLFRPRSTLAGAICPGRASKCIGHWDISNCPVHEHANLSILLPSPP